MIDLRPALVPLPAAVLRLLKRLAAAGGRPLLVGGCVRDALLARPTKDLDIEVHHLEAAELRGVLREFGRVDEVGRAFGVFKLRLGGEELDVSLPRRDSKVGAGHKGIQAVADPGLGVREAARRRDLTVNAIAWDALSGELLDPFGGVADLAAGRLRAVDDESFVEDPLRALRVAQFAARFGFQVAPELEALCASMALGELPAERVRGEVDKLLLKGRRPSLGWDFAWRARLWARVIPAWDIACPPAIDRLAALPLESQPRRLAVLLAASATGPGLLDTLERLRVFTWEGYDVRAQALALDAARREETAANEADRSVHAIVATTHDGVHDVVATGAAAPSADGAARAATRARRLAERVDVELYAALLDDPGLREVAESLGVLRAPLMPLLTGRDLLALGLPPGRQVGRILGEVRQAQLEGHLSSPEAALAWARTRVR